MEQADLATAIRGFFGQHLVSERGLSGHTILAYRDTMKLLLQFACRHHHKTCAGLSLQHLTADTMRRFLNHLEQERGNAAPTRNVRLAAIHSFFRYLAAADPRHLAHCQSILAIPFKRQAHRVPEYMERQEILSLFAGIDRRSLLGQRDDALLRILYNTGMRAQELVDLDVNHLRLNRPFLARIRGKGRKERTCPLWKETVDAIRIYLEARAERTDAIAPLFVGAGGGRLSRFGVRHIVAHRVAQAAKTCPTLLARRITPHTFRHTTAMHLLQSNVDLSMIRSWLGHASIETTSSYVEIDLEMKRKTLESCEKLIPKAGKRPPSWQRDRDILSWLSRL
jgi:site-specific recombinase XerD